MKALLVLAMGLMALRGDPLPRPEVERLVLFDPVNSELMTYEEWRLELRNRPDIKPDIFAMIDREMTSLPEDRILERMGKALAALQERTDLTPEELKRITDTLHKNSLEYNRKDRLANWYTSPGLRILKHYPSRENEDLALRFLQFDDSSIQFSALITLNAIGTEASMEALKAYAARKKPAPGNVSENYDGAQGAIRSIERRIQKQQRAANLESPSRASSKRPEAERAGSDFFPTGTASWIIGGIAFCIALSGVFVMMRRNDQA